MEQNESASGLASIVRAVTCLLEDVDDGGLRLALAVIGQQYGVERVCAFERSAVESRTNGSVRHELRASWTDPRAVLPPAPPVVELPPAWLAAAEQSGFLQTTSDALPAQEAAWLVSLQVSSLLLLLIQVEDPAEGVLCLDCARGARNWSAEELASLRLFADAVGARWRQQRRMWNAWQRKRHEALSRMAEGIGHELNNILTAVLGNAHLAIEHDEEGSSTKAELNEIIAATDRAAALARSLLLYTGRVTLHRVSLDLSAVLLDLEPRLRQQTPTTVGLQFELAHELPAVLADPAQVECAVTHLLRNGIEAVKQQGGTVVVRTRLWTPGMDECKRGVWAAGNVPHETRPYVAVEVFDSGHGADDNASRQMFDPYYSTKFAGRGLGLSVALGVALGHGGALGTCNLEGGGHVIRFLLPAQPEPAARIKDTGKGLVLIVDDEPLVLRLAASILEAAGYATLTANNGREAVAHYARERDSIRLVLLDVRMSDLNGPETYEELRAINPLVRVLFSSGYDDVSLLGDLEIQGGVLFIQKPYTPRELLNYVELSLARQ